MGLERKLFLWNSARAHRGRLARIHVGLPTDDLFMNLIRTRRLGAGNPLDYLNVVVRPANEVCGQAHPVAPLEL